MKAIPIQQACVWGFLAQAANGYSLQFPEADRIAFIVDLAATGEIVTGMTVVAYQDDREISRESY